MLWLELFDQTLLQWLLETWTQVKDTRKIMDILPTNKQALINKSNWFFLGDAIPIINLDYSNSNKTKLMSLVSQLWSRSSFNLTALEK